MCPHPLGQHQSQVIMLCASLSAPRSHRCHTGNTGKNMGESVHPSVSQSGSQSVQRAVAPPPRASLS